MDDEDLCYIPARDLARLIRNRELSPRELVEAVLRRIGALDSSLHAFSTVDAEAALAAARDAEAQVALGKQLMPLHGIPVSVQDLEPVAGLRLTQGSRFPDGAAEARLRRAGGVLLGKTKTPAFGRKDASDNLLMEATRNPWRPERTSGGSSSGAAAAVAAGFGPLAHGTDGAGSIRLSAAFCGVFGMKPSLGRVPSWPQADYWGARIDVGALARTVRDAAVMLTVMAGPDPRDPLSMDAPREDYGARCAEDVGPLRVGWMPSMGPLPVDQQVLRAGWSPNIDQPTIDPEVLRLTEKAALRFADLGCHVEIVTPPWEDPGEWSTVLHWASLLIHGPELTERPESVDSTLAAILEAGWRLTPADLVGAQEARAHFYDQARALMESYDLLLTPAMPRVAEMWNGEPAAGGRNESRGLPAAGWPLIYAFNLLGWPAASVPCGFTGEGLPVGLQIVAPLHQDARCLRASAAFEAIEPWASVRPLLA